MSRRDLIAWALWVPPILIVGSVAYALAAPIDIPFLGVHIRGHDWLLLWPAALIIPPPRIAKRLLRLGRDV